MEKEKEIAISIEFERVREKLLQMFESRTKALNEQNQALLEIMNVMKLKRNGVIVLDEYKCRTA